MQDWLTRPTKGRHRTPNRVTVRSVGIYALLGPSLLAAIVLAGLGYYVTFRSGLC